MFGKISIFNKKTSFDFEEYCKGYLDASARKRIRLRRIFSAKIVHHFNNEKNWLEQYFPGGQDSSLSQLMLEETHRLLEEKEITEGEELKSKLYAYIDMWLIADLKDHNTVLEKKANTFYFKWMTYLYNHPKIKSILPGDEEARIDAWQDAYAKCIRKVVNGEFQQYSSLFTYFFQFLEKECLAMRKHINRYKNRIYGNDIDALVNQLDPELQAKMNEPPRVFRDEFLQLAHHKYPECSALILKVKWEGFSYKELEDIYQKTAKQLKDKAYKCRSILLKMWKDLYSG